MAEHPPADPSPPDRPWHRDAEMEDPTAKTRARVDDRRADLLKLRRDLDNVPTGFNGPQAAELLEANQQLVLAALTAETIAETAVSNLNELARSSQRDTLTGTPNRAVMLDRLESAIAMARRHKMRSAVLFVDLDHFKKINDRLGHAAGDAALQRVARRLEDAVRDSDTVSRHGGDEFLVLLAEITQPSDAAVIAEKMLTTLAVPGQGGDETLPLSASIGIAIYPDDGEHAATLISKADASMYRAKRRGGGDYEFHTAEQPSALARAPSDEGRPPEPMARFVLRRQHNPMFDDLREANEQLVMSALAAQELWTQAEEAYRRQNQFLAMVAHELRNPLSPIRTAAEAMKHARLNEVLLDRLQTIIEDQVRHMSKLVDDLIDGARLGSGKFQLECSSVDILHTLKLAVETCRPAIMARRQELGLHLPDAPLNVDGDPVRLVQIFTNLLDNATKYTPEGGAIAVSVGTREQSVLITFSDNGIGITAEMLPRIFDAFVQDPRAQAYTKVGLGMGLAIVRGLVEAHGGSVVCISAGRNFGTEIIVELPIVDAR